MYFDGIQGVVGLVISLLTHGNRRKHKGNGGNGSTNSYYTPIYTKESYFTDNDEAPVIQYNVGCDLPSLVN